ncbi:MAG: hypothetical protein L6R36_006413 [Xanthoria steineri]|nr:MAG: hypothetical protein L6R36_006413 [Xanthoria steineri]
MHSIFAVLLAVSLLPFSTNGVSVTLTRPLDLGNPVQFPLTQVCNDIPPGRCCQGRPLPNLPGLINPAGQPDTNVFRIANWTGLIPLDIAAVWKPQGTNAGCRGTPAATRLGPGNWDHAVEQGSNDVIAGASYLRIPSVMPDDGVNSAWLEWQGILGMITGGGKWISKNAGSSLLQQAAREALRLKGGSPQRRRRGVRRGEPGVLLTQPPAGLAWPDTIIFNGTTFKEKSPGSSIYLAKDGFMLNMTATAD